MESNSRWNQTHDGNYNPMSWKTTTELDIGNRVRLNNNRKESVHQKSVLQKNKGTRKTRKTKYKESPKKRGERDERGQVSCKPQEDLASRSGGNAGLHRNSIHIRRQTRCTECTATPTNHQDGVADKAESQVRPQLSHHEGIRLRELGGELRSEQLQEPGGLLRQGTSRRQDDRGERLLLLLLLLFKR